MSELIHKCNQCNKKPFKDSLALDNHKMDKHTKQKSTTFFEMQEDAWLENNCLGRIEDYDGSEY